MAIQLSKDFSIESSRYANQGNSDIGIRGSGKTHTATKAAEDLMTDGFPIVVFDPSGVWHNLRYGKGKETGFPIVVAGGWERISSNFRIISISTYFYK